MNRQLRWALLFLPALRTIGLSKRKEMAAQQLIQIGLLITVLQRRRPR
jgi:hypothetical protein